MVLVAYVGGLLAVAAIFFAAAPTIVGPITLLLSIAYIPKWNELNKKYERQGVEVDAVVRSCTRKTTDKGVVYYVCTCHYNAPHDGSMLYERRVRSKTSKVPFSSMKFMVLPGFPRSGRSQESVTDDFRFVQCFLLVWGVPWSLVWSYVVSHEIAIPILFPDCVSCVSDPSFWVPAWLSLLAVEFLVASIIMYITYKGAIRDALEGALPLVDDTEAGLSLQSLNTLDIRASKPAPSEDTFAGSQTFDVELVGAGWVEGPVMQAPSCI